MPGAGIDPAENHQPGGDNRHDKNDKSDQCGRWVRINPVSIGLNAAPATPATGRRSSWPSSPAGQYGQSAYTPRGINHFPEGEDRRRDPHAHRLAPENIKPTRPITKQTVPKVISGRIFLALSRRPTAYCRATTTAALTGSTTATTFSAKSLLATTSTYCETGGEGAADEGGQQPGAGKPQQRPVAQQHRRRPGAAPGWPRRRHPAEETAE